MKLVAKEHVGGLGLDSLFQGNSGASRWTLATTPVTRAAAAIDRPLNHEPPNVGVHLLFLSLSLIPIASSICHIFLFFLQLVCS